MLYSLVRLLEGSESATAVLLPANEPVLAGMTRGGSGKINTPGILLWIV